MHCIVFLTGWSCYCIRYTFKICILGWNLKPLLLEFKIVYHVTLKLLLIIIFGLWQQSIHWNDQTFNCYENLYAGIGLLIISSLIEGSERFVGNKTRDIEWKLLAIVSLFAWKRTNRNNLIKLKLVINSNDNCTFLWYGSFWLLKHAVFQNPPNAYRQFHLFKLHGKRETIFLFYKLSVLEISTLLLTSNRFSDPEDDF